MKAKKQRSTIVHRRRHPDSPSSLPFPLALLTPLLLPLGPLLLLLLLLLAARVGGGRSVPLLLVLPLVLGREGLASCNQRRVTEGQVVGR